MPIWDGPASTQPSRWGRSCPFCLFQSPLRHCWAGTLEKVDLTPCPDITAHERVRWVWKAHGINSGNTHQASCRGTNPKNKSTIGEIRKATESFTVTVVSLEVLGEHSLIIKIKPLKSLSPSSPYCHRAQTHYQVHAWYPKTPPKLSLKSQPALLWSSLLLFLRYFPSPLVLSVLTNNQVIQLSLKAAMHPRTTFLPQSRRERGFWMCMCPFLSFVTLTCWNTDSDI